jgi:hypothetical protein
MDLSLLSSGEASQRADAISLKVKLEFLSDLFSWKICDMCFVPLLAHVFAEQG